MRMKTTDRHITTYSPDCLGVCDHCHAGPRELWIDWHLADTPGYCRECWNILTVYDN